MQMAINRPFKNGLLPTTYFKMEKLHVERRVYHPEHLYAGTQRCPQSQAVAADPEESLSAG